MSGSRSAQVAATIPRIRDPEAYAEGQWDLDIFDGCFGDTRIQPSDLDGVVAAVRADTLGVVERRGSVLFFEFKGRGGVVPRGQDLLFQTLTRTHGQFVLVVRGRRNEPEDYCVWKPDGPGEWAECTLESLRAEICVWWRWANGPWRG